MEQSIRIAIADDHNQFAARLEAYFRDSEQFTIAINGHVEEVLTQLQPHMADILLLDADLRHQDLRDKIDALWKQPGSYAFTFIVVTEIADKHAMQAAMKAGANYYVLKSDEEFEDELLWAIDRAYQYLQSWPGRIVP